MQQGRQAIIQRWSQKLEQELQKVDTTQNEAEFRRVVDRLLEDFCTEIDVNPLIQSEYTLSRGRADAVFNRFIIEYERPGTLKLSRNDKATLHAINQVKRYIEDLAKQERHSAERLAGIAFDGKYLIFVRYLDGRWVIEDPVPANQHSLERFLTWLSSLSSGIALTAENLNRDFSIEQLRTQNILRSLYNALTSHLQNPNSIVAKLFEQWRLFFSQAIDYSEAFGGNKLEPLKKWVRKAGLDIKSQCEAECFFFALHTYFALLAKLLAWLALSRHLGVKIGGPVFSALLSAESETLRQRLEEMESGGIFRKYGLNNLLEGDFFAWYLHAWDANIERALRDLLTRLDEYDPTTLTIVPEETRDLFKKLYHYLLPREVRHNLGEYYTPDWLAQRLLTQVDNTFFAGDPKRDERTLRQKLFSTRFLDPACGSGTFLILILARMQQLGKTLLVNESELLDAILNNVVGFDINPLAVLTARVNYLLAIADLLEHRKGDITLPIYLADSILTPSKGEHLFSHDTYTFPTAVGRFEIPAEIAQSGTFDRFCDMLDDAIHRNLPEDAFLSQVQAIKTQSPIPKHGIERIRHLYRTLSELHQQGLDGIWTRLLKNNFAPLTVGQFDYIVGNPPWINWEHLPDSYRDSTKDLWVHYRLAGSFKGGRPRLGAVKVDISALMTYVVIDKLLKKGGKLGFVVTQSLLKTAAGAGFRRFLLPDNTPLRVITVDDMVDLNPFEGASNRTAVIVLLKGQPNKYPVSYTLWRKVKGKEGRFTYESTLDEVRDATQRMAFQAEPVDPHDDTSQWLTARSKALKAVRKVLGESFYVAHLGCNTGGANAVYWVEQVYVRPDGLVVVQNITEGAKTKVSAVSDTIEPDLLYPLLRGRDVSRWCAKPFAWIIVPQDPNQPNRAYPEAQIQKDYPRTYGYLKQFEPILRKRSGYVQILSKREKEFYGLMDIDTYTFAPWKVVWTRVANIQAAVAPPHEGKPVLPQETITLVDCHSAEEAHYVASVVNSSPFQFAVASYSQEGGKSMGTPNILEYIRIPRFDPNNPVHRRLAKLSMEAHQLAPGLGNLPNFSDDVFEQAETFLSAKSATAQQQFRELREKVNRFRDIESEIDRLSAQLWGLTDDELAEVQRSLEELG